MKGYVNHRCAITYTGALHRNSLPKHDRDFTPKPFCIATMQTGEGLRLARLLYEAHYFILIWHYI
jgi:hypothetical protein